MRARSGLWPLVSETLPKTVEGGKVSFLKAKTSMWKWHKAMDSEQHNPTPTPQPQRHPRYSSSDPLTCRGSPIPGLPQRWKLQVEDGLSPRCPGRAGLSWHSGEPLQGSESRDIPLDGDRGHPGHLGVRLGGAHAHPAEPGL